MQLLRELINQALVNQEAIGRGAGLTHVAQFGKHCALDRSIQIRIFEDQKRRIATQFHRNLQDLLRSIGDKALTDRG